MKKGKIYKMENEYGIYYGSTTLTLKDRLRNHKSSSSTTRSSRILFQNGCIPKIELIEEVEFDDIKELWDREAYYIRNLECINLRIPNRTKKQYYNDNKVLLNKKNQQNRIVNKEKYAKKKKQYYETNKDIMNEKAKIKITCDCGVIVSKSHLARHCKSKKHQNFINSQNIVV